MLPVDRWYQAIWQRRSTRNYNGKAIEEEKLAALHDVCRTYRPANGVRAELVEESGAEIFTGLVGSYGKIKNNPAFVAFIGSSHSPDMAEMLGYLGEGIILEATAQGLATCWVGGMFKKEAAAVKVSLSAGETLVALTPLGYPLERITFDERLMRGFKTGQKRKTLTELVTGLPPEQWPAWASAGFEAARPAPSAMNRQPWRFHVERDSVLLTCENKNDISKIPRRLDCGIAMLHFELGALAQGVELKRELLAQPEVARYSVS